MPLFLQGARGDKQEYSRMVCVRSARAFLEAYLLLHESNPAAAHGQRMMIMQEGSLTMPMQQQLSTAQPGLITALANTK